MLRCKRCQTQFQPEDVDLQLQAAKCRACGAVTDLRRQSLTSRVESAEVPVPAPVPEPRSEVPLPAKFQRFEAGGVVVIQWRWFGRRTLTQAVVVVIWAAVLVGFFHQLPQKGSSAAGLFSLLFCGFWVYLVWSTLAGFFNSTRVEVSRAGLRLESGPLPLKRNHRLTRRDLQQIFCRERVHRSRNSTRIDYSLEAVLANKRTLTLFTGLEKVEQALYLEEQVELALGIVDLPVADEVRQKAS